MEMERALIDLARVRKSIRKVLDSARAESIALSDAIAAHPSDAMIRLRTIHLQELDAVQALAASLELFEKRLPGIERAIDVSRRCTCR